MSYRRVQRESDELYCTRFGHSLWSANQLPAQGVKQTVNVIERIVQVYGWSKKPLYIVARLDMRYGFRVKVAAQSCAQNLHEELAILSPDLLHFVSPPCSSITEHEQRRMNREIASSSRSLY